MARETLMMHNKVLSWNVRGLGAAEKRVLVKRTLKKTKAEIIIIQEYKLELVTNQDILEITGTNHWSWSFLPAAGTCGGIIILWDGGKVAMSNECIGLFTLTMDTWTDGRRQPVMPRIGQMVEDNQ